MSIMRKCFKVSYYVRSNYVNKQGKSPLMLRVFLNGNMSNFGSTGLCVDKKLWSNSTNRMKGRTVEALNANAQLDLISSSLFSLFKKYEDDDDLTLEKLKSIYLGKDSSMNTVMNIFDKYLDDLRLLVGTTKTKSTFDKYAVVRKHFLSFLKYKYGRNDIMPKELTYVVVYDFDVYLKTVVLLKSNSAIKTLKFFKTVIIFALKSGMISHDPFINFRFQVEKVDRGFLTDEEIQNIMRKTFVTPRLEQVRDIFIFSCFTGLAYIDMVNLTESNIVVMDEKKWIVVNRHKTNVPSNILLLDIPLAIIDKYKGKSKNGRLLPILSNQKMNAYLKEIADVCGINKRLTCHLARHTFATLTLSKGVPIETVSKMLGHTNIKTTQIYARITNKKIENDMMALASKLDKFNNIVDV